MTNQETFDTVVAHARKQGCRAVNGDGNCVYRGFHGLKCFAGALIADDNYSPSFEGENAKDLSIFSQLGYDVELVSDLQAIHDTWDPEKWEDCFQYIARKWDLVYS